MLAGKSSRREHTHMGMLGQAYALRKHSDAQPPVSLCCPRAAALTLRAHDVPFLLFAPQKIFEQE